MKRLLRKLVSVRSKLRTNAIIKLYNKHNVKRLKENRVADLFQISKNDPEKYIKMMDLIYE